MPIRLLLPMMMCMSNLMPTGCVTYEAHGEFNKLYIDHVNLWHHRKGHRAWTSCRHKLYIISPREENIKSNVLWTLHCPNFLSTFVWRNLTRLKICSVVLFLNLCGNCDTKIKFPIDQYWLCVVLSARMALVLAWNTPQVKVTFVCKKKKLKWSKHGTR